MSLKETIIAEFKQAFKEKNMEKKNVLSMLQSEIKNKEIELMKRDDGLSDEEVIAVISRAIKQRKDSAQQYREGGREELATQEEAEIAILSEYMPEQMSDEEIKQQVQAVIAESGATSKAEMGKVMGAAMARMKGKADGNKVREIVEQLLS